MPFGRRKVSVAGPSAGRNRRLAGRTAVGLPAIVETFCGNWSACLADISRTGALIEGETLPSVGQDVVLRSGGFEVFGKIAWNRQCRCGVEFSRIIPAEQVDKLGSAGQELKVLGIDPGQKAIEDDWASGFMR